MGMPKRQALDLFAIQARMELEDYFSAEAFDQRVFSYLSAVNDRRDAARPAVIVFPEDIGMFLVALGCRDALDGCATTDAAFNRLGRKFALPIAWSMLRYRQTNPKTAFWLARAGLVRDTMIRTFSRFALESKAFVVAGSASLPQNKHGLVLRPFSALGGKVYNLSYTFNPAGRLLAETAKVNLVPGMEDGIGLSAGLSTEVKTVDLEGVKLGTAICYDGFRIAHTPNEPGYAPLLPVLDRMGVEVVAQPSANPWPWEERWVFAGEGDTRLRKEQWIGEGAASLLPQLSKVAYLVNPQLVAAFLDVHFDGRSFIMERSGTTVTTLAEAKSIDQGEVVHTTAFAGERADLSPNA
jgi:predicted amidohydrolase